jgi:peptide/nickel transport system substrate-binding protein
LIVIALAAVAACAILSTEERPADGGTFREGVVGQPLSLNPLLHPTDPIVRDLQPLIFAGLVRVTEGGRIEPDLASEWTTADQGRTYRFKLRRATWHDGQRVRSADVVATVGLLQSGVSAGSPELTDLWRRVRVEAPDADTVVFHLDEPFAPFIEACAVPLLPQHIFGGDPNLDLAQHPASYAPVGAGPFKVQSLDPGGVVLTRHDGYPGQKPHLESLQIRYFPDAASARDALLAGAIDGFAGLSRGDVGSLSSAAFVVRDPPLGGHQTQLVMNTRNVLLSEPRVRRALTLAIDRTALVNGPFATQAIPAYGPVPAYSWAYDQEVEQASNPSLAMQTLEQAGWTAGRPRRRDGQTLTLRLFTTLDERQIALGRAIADQLEAVGARAELAPTYVLDLYRERLIPRQFDLALVGVWLGTRDPDPYALWHSSQATNGFNFASYSRPEADRSLELARSDGDPTRRFAALTAFQQQWMEDSPAVVLANPVLIYAVGKQFRGVRLGILHDPGDRFQHIAEWHVRTERVPVLPGR